jgi:hypothetical protein
MLWPGIETRFWPVDQQNEMLESLLSPTDAAALTGEFAEWMLRHTQDGLAPGDQGWWDDGAAEFLPWGFDIGSVSVPVKVWHGRHDRFVPFQHGQCGWPTLFPVPRRRSVTPMVI